MPAARMREPAHVAQEPSDIAIGQPTTSEPPVQLFAEGVLKPIGGPCVDLQVGNQDLGPCQLEGVETDDDAGPPEETVLLRFRRGDP